MLPDFKKQYSRKLFTKLRRKFIYKTCKQWVAKYITMQINVNYIIMPDTQVQSMYTWQRTKLD